jgi:hypothetical protein
MRPQLVGIAPDAYGSRRTLELSELLGTQTTDLAIFFSQVLDALYLQPSGRAFLPMEIDDLKEIAVLQVWSQQWPKLRRSFRFCTLAFADRSLSETEPFDLQFGPISVLAKLRGTIEPSAGASDQRGNAWRTTAVTDLVRGVPGLRSFLRTSGADINDGRTAFTTLVSIYDAMSEARALGRFDSRLIRFLEDHVPAGEGQGLRTSVVNWILESVEASSDADIDYALQNAALMDADLLNQNGQSLSERIWRSSPQRFIDLLSGSTPVSTIARKSLCSMPPNVLFDGLTHAPRIADVVLQFRPEVFRSPDFWRLTSDVVDIGLRHLTPSHEGFAPAFKSMMVADRADLAARAVAKIGAQPVLDAVLDHLSVDGGDSRSIAYPWLRACASYPGAVAEALARGHAKTRNTLALIARVTTPDMLPNDFGDDPWWIALQSAAGELSSDSSAYLAAYVLARALGYRSRSQAELAADAFDDVYLPAMRSQLSNEAWQLVERRLPRSMWGFEWDRCRRLRAGLVAMFVERNLLVSCFAKVTKSDDVFRELVYEASETSRGRAYLRHTLAQPSLETRRANIIENAVD